jgi:hypothetical protein
VEDDACLSLRLGIALRTSKVSSLDSSHPWDYVFKLVGKNYIICLGFMCRKFTPFHAMHFYTCEYLFNGRFTSSI